MPGKYIFTSARLGFRNWEQADIAPMAAINSDSEVMQFFPHLQTMAETEQFVARMQNEFAERKHCYFAVDKLENNEFIGFIGLSYKTFVADFTPCVDIGWRLSKHEWGHGYATEGAKRCLEYGFNNLSLPRIAAIAPLVNVKSIQVMQKIGMTKVKDFIHPLLWDDERLRNCALYEIARLDF
jgi:RimJ/RimL family protein N-acetyltransferase